MPDTCYCRKCFKTGFVIDEFTSPYTGLCAECSKGGMTTRESERECNCFSGKIHHNLVHELWCRKMTGRREEELERIASRCLRTYEIYKAELELLNHVAREKGYC